MIPDLPTFSNGGGFLLLCIIVAAALFIIRLWRNQA